jgi:Domain of unknown function (DUF4124)
MALIALCVLTTPATFATTVYRWTDAAGVVHFSDQPMPGAEKMTIGPPRLYDTPKSPTSAQAPRRPPDAPKPSQPHLGYTSIAVTAPTAEKTYFEEPVPVALTLVPALRDGDNITWYLNGAAQEQKGESFTFTHLDRGAYTLYATITDSGTQESTNSPTVNFYVRQTSILSPQYPKK